MYNRFLSNACSVYMKLKINFDKNNSLIIAPKIYIKRAFNQRWRNGS